MGSRHVQIANKSCTQCGQNVKAERNASQMGCGDLVMVLLTFGLWVVIRQLFKKPWLCTQCGSKV